MFISSNLPAGFSEIKDYSEVTFPVTAVVGYKGKEIEIIHDDSPINPWVDWDCCAPLLSTYEGRVRDWNKDLDSSAPYLSEAVVRKNIGEIVNILEGGLRFTSSYTVEDLINDACYGDVDDLYDADGNLVDDENVAVDKKISLIADYVNGGIDEAIAQRSAGDQLEALCELWKMTGAQAFTGSVWGYNQGDYSELLVVYTPEWCKYVGIDPKEHDFEKDAQGAMHLFECWAFGDVYGFSVRDEDEACGGFYGRDFDKEDSSGIVESIKESVDYIVEVEELEAAERREMEYRGIVTTA